MVQCLSNQMRVAGAIVKCRAEKRNTQLVYDAPTDERLPKPTSVKTNSENSGVLRSVAKEPEESEQAEESSKKR
uniref:Uncharacterized protein n=1 Tax=Mycena chlorophos TaxID=658473 RepID=A0ABQ0LFS1_MYCCL|nr:predicted protein [Mycena chlorophos]